MGGVTKGLTNAIKGVTTGLSGFTGGLSGGLGLGAIPGIHDELSGANDLEDARDKQRQLFELQQRRAEIQRLQQVRRLSNQLVAQRAAALAAGNARGIEGFSGLAAATTSLATQQATNLSQAADIADLESRISATGASVQRSLNAAQSQQATLNQGFGLVSQAASVFGGFI